jgi:hypothetical protein
MINKKRVAGLLVLFAGLVMILSSCGHSSNHAGTSIRPSSSATNAPVAMKQPESASDIALSLNCKDFVDHGKAQLFSIDSGVCYIGSKKYAINTFASKAGRDAWLKAAKTYGVVPRWETATAVVYPSVNS